MERYLEKQLGLNLPLCLGKSAVQHQQSPAFLQFIHGRQNFGFLIPDKEDFQLRNRHGNINLLVAMFVRFTSVDNKKCVVCY